MKKSRFTEEQILFALKQADAGQAVADVCRQIGISEATFYVWKKRYANLGLLEVRELRQLRDENARLKRLVADLTLDRHVPTPGYRAMDTRLLSAERTQVLQFELPASGHLVLPLSITRQSGLRQRRRELATARPRFGYERLHILLTREGWRVGRNRVHRLYKLEGLQVRMRVRRKKRISLHRSPVPIATAGGQYWAIDFVHDQLANGSKFRVLTVIDKWHRQCVALQADYSLTVASCPTQ